METPRLAAFSRLVAAVDKVRGTDALGRFAASRAEVAAAALGAENLFDVYPESVGPALNPILLRPPSAILKAFGELIANGELQTAFVESMRVFSVGLAIALIAGVILGVLTGRSRLSFNLLDPWVSALYSVPSVALVPLIAVAFRYQGEAPRIATVVLFAIFPILINTQQGVRNVDRGLLEVARAFSSSERRLWRDVVVPTSLSSLFVLPRGNTISQPSEHLLRDSTDQMLKEIYQHYDYIVIDSSPVLAADDTTSLAPKIDATLFVVRLAYTSARLTKKALELLYSRQVNVPGVILNYVDTSLPEYYYYQYSEYYNTPAAEAEPVHHQTTGQVQPS